MPAVPIGAAGKNFFKFDTFSCILKAIFRFLFPRQGGGISPFLYKVDPALGGRGLAHDFLNHFLNGFGQIET